MTVAELIEELKKCPPDYLVVYPWDTKDKYYLFTEDFSIKICDDEKIVYIKMEPIAEEKK